MSERLRHRGPDDSGTWQDGTTAFAHRRLAILDLSSNGRQPMHSRSGRWTIVFNGEIYNFLDLRKGLEGPWASDSDTEVLVQLLDARGIEAVRELTGMFAFAAWDRETRALYLVRDRIGIKPLFYAVEKRGLLFASEAGALAASDERFRKLDRASLGSYLLLGYPHVDRTLFTGISALPPATIAVYDGNRVHLERYWSLPDTHDATMSAVQAQEQFAELWPTVVRDHLQADVPVGIFLSGGIDSAAVATALRDIKSPPRLYTISFRDQTLDESPDASALAKRLNLEHVVLPCESIDVSNMLSDVSARSDLPLSDSSMIGTWILSAEARKQVTVALSGDGADELFAGYATHGATEWMTSPIAPLFRAFSWAFGRFVGAMPYREGRPSSTQGKRRFLRYARHGLRAHLRWRTLIDESEFPKLLKEPFPADWTVWEALLNEHSGHSRRNRALAADVSGYLVQDELVRADRSSMAHGLELRVPFLDHRIVELAFRMPYSMKNVRGIGPKSPIRIWLTSKGEREVLHKPKRGFNHPVAEWFQGDLGDRLGDRLTSDGLATMFRRELVEKWLHTHRARKADRSYELWTILTLLEWGHAHGMRP